jgi:branched-chain amino acid transport system ATP-binding protein
VTARLECRGLRGGRDSATAFRDVDLSVQSGTVFALLGPNGAGKTTLLLTVAGFLRPHAGTITIDGEELRPGRAALANRMGIVLVPDNRALFATLTVEQNLRAGARRGARPEAEMFDLFPLLRARRRLPAGALSGGEQQMLVMARAIIQRPRVLLIDEMSMGLAPIVVETLFRTVRDIATDHGCAVVLVEQHVSLALNIADRAAVLNRGSVVLQGVAGDLAREPDRLERAYLGMAEDPVTPLT